MGTPVESDPSASLRASVVVPVRDGARVIDRCLGALARQTLARDAFEVIVVDDGSCDRTAAAARAHPIGARVVEQAPLGPSAARNHGVREALTPIVAFTDADCAPAPDWLEALLAAFDDPSVAGAKGVYETRQRSLAARFVQQEYEDRYRRMTRFDRIDFIDTYCCAYRKAALDAAGGFDERYATASTEDQELSFRVAASGAKLVFRHEARVEHLHADSAWRYARKKWKIGVYKAATLRSHPGKAARDAHTPPVLKLQAALGAIIALCCCAYAATLLASLTLLVWWTMVTGILSWGDSFAAFRWLALLAHAAQLTGLTSCALILTSALAFLADIARRDPLVLLVAPLLVLIRAIALGGGLLWGSVREVTGFSVLRAGPRPQPAATPAPSAAEVRP